MAACASTATPAFTFQYTSSGTTAVVAYTALGVAAGTRAPNGLRVYAPAGNSGVVYYGYDSTVTSSTGTPLPAGVYTVIPPAGFAGALANLWFLTASSGDKVWGERV